eukprot:scaffold2270_cov362-Prasinococcus_capsulatus_cf.AAC.4
MTASKVPLLLAKARSSFEETASRISLAAARIASASSSACLPLPAAKKSSMVLVASTIGC